MKEHCGQPAVLILDNAKRLTHCNLNGDTLQTLSEAGKSNSNIKLPFKARLTAMRGPTFKMDDNGNLTAQWSVTKTVQPNPEQ